MSVVRRLGLGRKRWLWAATWSLLLSSPATVARAQSNAPPSAGTVGEGGLRPGEFRQRNGEVRDADQAYQELNDTGEPKPLRAAGEMLLILGIGTTWYWSTREDNARDWDQTALAGRVNGDAWSFDNNSLAVNFIYHSLSGTAYYGVSRANHLTMPVAYGYAFGSSLLWDFALEFNERISISDVIVTPSAGLVIGEYLHKLSWYLNGVPRRPSTTQKVLRYAPPIGLSVALHRAWDGAPDPVPHELDNLGYDADLWHSFEFDYRLMAAEVAGQTALQHSVGHRGQLIAIPGFMRAGSHSRFFANADFSTLEVRTFGSEHGSGFDLQADAMLLGWFGQNFTDDRHGEAHVVGIGMGHRYLNTHSNGPHEFYGALHFPGPGLDFWAREGLLGVQLSARGNFDLAGVGSRAYELWREENPGVRTKNVLTKQGYYMGFGFSGRLAADVEVGPARLRWNARLARYDSQEGLDRAQDEVEVDLHGQDAIAEWNLEGSLGLVDLRRAGWGLRLGGNLGERHWSSQAGESRTNRVLREAGGNVSVVF